MAATPAFKVYSKDNEYLAATKRAEEAGAVVALLGPGATIRFGHSSKMTVWTEGVDGLAGDSYDITADKVYSRAAELATLPA